LVAFRDTDQARAAAAAIEATAIRLGIKPEFKFSKCRPEVRDAFFAAVTGFWPWTSVRRRIYPNYSWAA
jgi:hypothetical protein